MKLANTHSKLDNFSDDETDYLTELLNIGHGHSAAVMAEILDHFVTLNVPEIHFFRADEYEIILSSLTREDRVYTLQSFWGPISGQTFFVLDKSSLGNLRKIFEEEEIEDDDILLELINIMNSTLISRIAMELNTQTTFDLPSVETGMSINNLATPLKAEYSQAIALTTMLNFKDIGVDINIIIFMHDDTITWIQNSIKQKIDELLEWN